MFFIPFIIAAVTATSTGLTVANEVTDGAVYAPNITRYKNELKQETKVNETLRTQLTGQVDKNDRIIADYNQLGKNTKQLIAHFNALETQAQADVTQELVPDEGRYYVPYQGDRPIDAALIAGWTTLSAASTGYAIYVNSSASGAMGEAAVKVGTQTVESLKKLKAVKNLSKLAASGKSFTIASKAVKGLTLTGKAISSALGPVTIGLDIAFIGLDVANAKKKEAAYKKARDEALATNKELRGIINEMKAQVGENQKALHDLRQQVADLLVFLEQILVDVDGFLIESGSFEKRTASYVSQLDQIENQQAYILARGRFFRELLIQIKFALAQGADIDSLAEGLSLPADFIRFINNHQFDNPSYVNLMGYMLAKEQWQFSEDRGDLWSVVDATFTTASSIKRQLAFRPAMAFGEAKVGALSQIIARQEVKLSRCDLVPEFSLRLSDPEDMILSTASIDPYELQARCEEQGPDTWFAIELNVEVPFGFATLDWIDGQQSDGGMISFRRPVLDFFN